jgi:hypothetical protein
MKRTETTSQLTRFEERGLKRMGSTSGPFGVINCGLMNYLISSQSTRRRICSSGHAGVGLGEVDDWLLIGHACDQDDKSYL